MDIDGTVWLQWLCIQAKSAIPHQHPASWSGRHQLTSACCILQRQLPGSLYMTSAIGLVIGAKQMANTITNSICAMLGSLCAAHRHCRTYWGLIHSCSWEGASPQIDMMRGTQNEDALPAMSADSGHSGSCQSVWGRLQVVTAAEFETYTPCTFI